MESSPQASFMVWASSATEEERFRALGQFLDCFEFEERKQVQNKVNIVWKKKIRNGSKGINKLQGPPQRPSAVPVSPKEVPVSAEAQSRRGWWCKYKKSDIVSLDCEFVDLYEPHELTGLKIIAAEVSIANFKKEIIYSKRITHQKWTFKDNIMANYKSKDGIEGSDFKTVRDEVQQLLCNKLVVTVAGAGDFSALDLPISNFDVFDLHWFFKKKNNQFDRKTGEPIFQPIGLKSLYHHYISKKSGAEIQESFHNSDEDSLATMEVFHKYTEVKKTNLDSRYDNDEIDEDIVTIKSDYRYLRNLFYGKSK